MRFQVDSLKVEKHRSISGLFREVVASLHPF
jgi:hypothetical protein